MEFLLRKIHILLLIISFLGCILSPSFLLGGETSVGSYVSYVHECGTLVQCEKHDDATYICRNIGDVFGGNGCSGSTQILSQLQTLKISLLQNYFRRGLPIVSALYHFGGYRDGDTFLYPWVGIIKIQV